MKMGFFNRNSPIKAMLVIAACMGTSAFGQAGKRCDRSIKSTPPGAGGNPACLDLIAMQQGGAAISAPVNATRISTEGLLLCPNVFGVPTKEADIVFIYDNSGSMMANWAYLDPISGEYSFYYNTSGTGCNTAVTGSYTYTLANGSTRTVDTRGSNTGCTGPAGDPYMARGEVIKRGIDYMAGNAPTSTAGTVGFTNVIAYPQPLVPVNVPANVAALKAGLTLDTTGGTVYGPPLRQAYTWLNDTSLTQTPKRAIVFISDGAPTDISGASAYINDVNRNLNIPIFSIFLGNPDAQYQRLQQMSDLTRGTFNLVPPGDVAQMDTVMKRIIESIVRGTPETITIRNNTTNQISQGRVVPSSDTTVSVRLDSILALREGINSITVSITLNNQTKTYNFNVDASGPVAGVDTPELKCYDPPTLVMINISVTPNQIDTVYPPGVTNYTVRLSRATNDLSSVTVSEISRDSSRAGWGDQESVTLNLQAGTSIYTGPEVVNGSIANPARNNGTLESDLNAELFLSWVHPRDPREFATYTLPGRKIQILNPPIVLDRVKDVSGGVIPPNVAGNPGVIILGGQIVGSGDTTRILNPGCVFPATNCNLNLPPTDVNSFVLRKIPPVPFNFTIHVYDHLGQYVYDTQGRFDGPFPAAWITPGTDGEPDAASIMVQVKPVAKNGRSWGTGVYVFKIVITSEGGDFRNSRGELVRFSSRQTQLIQRSGYVRGRVN